MALRIAGCDTTDARCTDSALAGDHDVTVALCGQTRSRVTGISRIASGPTRAIASSRSELSPRSHAAVAGLTNLAN
ncbi:MAG TPA: hypothetical protein VK601_19760, partial [Kofleriaceae bacterium]|nr:hypothetical protein [Kofleriaceae bacterium]